MKVFMIGGTGLLGSEAAKEQAAKGIQGGLNMVKFTDVMCSNLFISKAETYKFVYIGTVAETGDRMPPIHWGRVGGPIKPSVFDYYAVSKAAAERYVIEAGLKYWVSLRQTGIMGPAMAKIRDAIQFHNCIDNVLEYVSDRDSGRAMRNLCAFDAEGTLDDSFWSHIYNIGGGESCRVSTGEMYEIMYGKLGFKSLDPIIEPKYNAARNFHGQYYLDSDNLEDYFTKERITEETRQAGEQDKPPFREQLRQLFTDKYMLIIYGYFFVTTVGTTIKNLGLVYYCNYVLGTYNDGRTQMLVSVIGGIPMGIGIFAVWPLAKKYGKRNVTVVGCSLIALGSLICWLFPTKLVIVLIGQFIKNMGGLPGSYVFMALFADCLDHMEWKHDNRVDGTAMSIYNIIAVAMIGVMTGVFNMLLAKALYVAPITASSIADANAQIDAHNAAIPQALTALDRVKWVPQIALDSIKPTADGTLTVAMQQLPGVNRVITFAFVGLEVFTAIIALVLLLFLRVEKRLPREQAEIRARHGN